MLLRLFLLILILSNKLSAQSLYPYDYISNPPISNTAFLGNVYNFQGSTKSNFIVNSNMHFNSKEIITNTGMDLHFLTSKVRDRGIDFDCKNNFIPFLLTSLF